MQNDSKAKFIGKVIAVFAVSFVFYMKTIDNFTQSDNIGNFVSVVVYLSFGSK